MDENSEWLTEKSCLFKVYESVKYYALLFIISLITIITVIVCGVLELILVIFYTLKSIIHSIKPGVKNVDSSNNV